MTALAPPRRLSGVALRDVLLVGLMFSSGTVDAVAFLGLGKVFTSFQTGNLVFVGIEAVEAGGPPLHLAVGSLVAFAAGVALATRMIGSSETWSPRVSLALGVSLGVQTAFFALWAATGGRPGGSATFALVALSALAMGLQSGAVMSLGVTGVFTTAATATVIFLARDLAAGREASSAERARLAAVLAALCSGAAAGGALLVGARALAPAPGLAVTALVIAVALRSRRLIG